jgi:hypothetical protein
MTIQLLIKENKILIIHVLAPLLHIFPLIEQKLHFEFELFIFLHIIEFEKKKL